MGFPEITYHVSDKIIPNPNTYVQYSSTWRKQILQEISVSNVQYMERNLWIATAHKKQRG